VDDFKPIELNDKQIFQEYIAKDPPLTSELTFTNLFMWRKCNRTLWKEEAGCLLVVLRPEDKQPFGLPPVGPGDKATALEKLAEYLTTVSDEPGIARVGKSFVDRYVDKDQYSIVEDRDQSDYVYRAQDLIKLPGKRFHKKKNHVNKFVKNNEFEYRSLDETVLKNFMDLQEDWCELRDCESNQDLSDENVAVYEALLHHQELDFRGGAILIDAKVEAFALGEMLNENTAVIHIEKANPDIPGLYATINQRFCSEEWSHVEFVNREQDLGVPGLRKAKLSYQPDHLVDKFLVIPRSA
jgi:hypothetical protein